MVLQLGPELPPRRLPGYRGAHHFDNYLKDTDRCNPLLASTPRSY
jgi:hypothetical protein